jgi:hypothetical protein
MNQIQLESAETELFSYLNGLINERLYPYLYQASGTYRANALHEKIDRAFKRTAKGITENKDESEERIEECASEICQFLNEDLMDYLLSKATETVFLIDFKAFQKMIKDKIIEILGKSKN